MVENTNNVVAIAPMSDEDALAWIAAQDRGRTTLPATQLAQRFGWPYQRTNRRISAWKKAKLIRRRGKAIIIRRENPQPVETTPENVTALASTAASATLPVSAVTRTSVTPKIADTVTHRRVSDITVCTIASALALATVSAGFSITGLTSIFIGSTWPVIAMGVALEGGKLSAVAWLARHRATAPRRLRTALGVLVAVLMALNAIGAYGFLAKAHIGHAVDSDVAAEGLAADIEARISVQTGVVGDLDARIRQIDGAVEKATAKGRTAAAMQLAADQRKARTELVAQRTSEARTLAGLQVERARVDGARRKAEADLGPVKYLSTLLGAPDDDVLRYFTLVVSLLLDPAAVLLLAAATRRTA